MAQSLVSVALHGATILAVLVNGIPHVSLRSLCDALGIDFDAQRHRIRRHPVLASTAVVTTAVAADGKARETLCLPLDYLNGWLFGISAARVRPELRERLIAYQRECFAVLARHFGAAAPGAAVAVRHPMAGVRLLVEHDASGQIASARPLPADAQVGTWLELADLLQDIHHQRLPHPVALRLAEAATLRLCASQPALPTPYAQEVEGVLADPSTSLVDLHRIAVAASAQLWARTRSEAKRQGRNPGVAQAGSRLG